MEDKHKRRNRNRRYMINRIAIQQWSEHAPWIDNAQIEQDLIICRAYHTLYCRHPQLCFQGSDNHRKHGSQSLLHFLE